MQTEWQTRSLDECLESEFPGEWGDTPASRPANALVLRSTNLDDEGHVDLAGAAPRVVPRSKLAAKRLREGDILLEASGGGPGKPVGRVALFQPDSASDYLASNFFRTLRPDPKVAVPAFLTWRLQHLWRSPRIWTYQQQTTGITNLNVREYLSSEFEMPSCPEQSCVAAILDTLDETIRKSRDLIAKLQQTTQGLRHDLLTRGLDENGGLRPPPEDAPHLYADSPIGKIPKGWCVREIGRLGTTVTGSTPPSLIPGVWGDGLGFVTPGEISEDGALLTPQRHVSRKGQRYVRILPEGSLLTVCIGATIGKTALSDALCATNQQINAVIPYSDTNARYLESALRLHVRQLLCLAGLQAVPIVNRTQFGTVRLPTAPYEEQCLIGERLEACERRVQTEQASLAKLHLLMRGLAGDLLTGRVPALVPEEART